VSAVDPLVLVTRRRGTPATRRRIAEAALDLFTTRGYAASSLQAIADAAGLHVQTIYQTYGSKPAVLAAACELARAGDDDDPEALPTEWRWAKAVMAEVDPTRQIAGFATHIRATAPKAGPLVAEIRSAARSDAALASFLAHAEAGRYLGPSGIAALLEGTGALRPGLDVARAADTIFAVASYEGYDLLVNERGWTAEEYEQWLAATLCELLLEPTS
jgi:AcrR family transcriptional regulator